MSASLVGSEMCIRDRSPPLTTEVDNGDCLRMCATHVNYDNVLQTGSADAVSYTHLTLPTICSV
eukprot:9200260-Alexandrium_andersonii.AAC.1